MAVSGRHFPIVVYLHELDIHCGIVIDSFGRLESGLAGYVDATEDHDGPLMLYASILAILSSAATISRILFAGGRQGTYLQKRCAAIESVVQISDLKTLSRREVRNSFEHLDERMDKAFADFHGGDYHFPPRVEEGEPDRGLGIAERRIDPKTMKLYFLDSTLDLVALLVEIRTVRQRIATALSQIGKHDNAVL